MGPQPITPGENLPGIPSDGWNGFVEVYKRVMGGGGAGNGPGGSSGAKRLTILLRNDTGADIAAQFGVLELDGPVFNTDDRDTVIYEGIAFKGITPTAAATAGNVAILQGPVAMGASTEAVLIGPTWCKIELPIWDMVYTTAGATTGDSTKLTAGGAGITVDWHATPVDAMAPTEVWAAVRLGGGGGGGDSIFPFLTDATSIPAGVVGPEVTDGGTGDKTVSITPGEFEAYLFTTGEARTYDGALPGPAPTTTIKNYYLDSYVFPSATWVTGICALRNGEYVLVELSCAYQSKE